MRKRVQRIYSGLFRCADCDSEWRFKRTETLACPECGSSDLEPLDEAEAEDDEK